ncbi:Uncharacterised protein [Burkholderia pseudomallei]|nr:Uncharacterised protein [Burkholderia pseudomallei]CAJ4553749.1 Uncharacterised protein [Burkholderia pseudomallei]
MPLIAPRGRRTDSRMHEPPKRKRTCGAFGRILKSSKSLSRRRFYHAAPQSAEARNAAPQTKNPKNLAILGVGYCWWPGAESNHRHADFQDYPAPKIRCTTRTKSRRNNNLTETDRSRPQSPATAIASILPVRALQCQQRKCLRFCRKCPTSDTGPRWLPRDTVSPRPLPRRIHLSSMRVSNNSFYAPAGSRVTHAQNFARKRQFGSYRSRQQVNLQECVWRGAVPLKAMLVSNFS